MSATTQDRNAGGADLNETVAYESDSCERQGRNQPATGSSDMPTPSPQGQNRYTFSSGARPLDGYTIKRAIGRGGFGEVYYATSDAGKEVALKLILRNLEVERRGVGQCMNLKCPNLVTVYDMRTTDADDTFVIMEYVAGPSLANVLAQHWAVCRLRDDLAPAQGLAEGVNYLHDHGIVHRDLKPANLFMEEGTVKIGDYGLAKLIAQSQGGTEHSESIGTCHYMAPEIASGKYNKPIDIYAMGVILYEMLTGRVPFDGESVGEVIMKHLTARADVSALAEPYRSIVARALAKDPNHRPSRAYDLLPPADAPKSPGVRFIGAGKTSPPLPEEPGAGRNGKGRGGKDDVLVIEAEEPVFYIGPETRPNREAIAARLRANWAAVRRNRVAQAQEAVRRAALRAQRVVAPPPPAPPEPPELPSPRVRVAETASSMLWAAPAAALFSIPAAFWSGVDPSTHPEQLAFIFGMSLLGAWAAFAPNKLLEGRTVSKGTRRALNLGMGALVGLLGAALGSAIELGGLPGGSGWGARVDLVDPAIAELTGPFGHPTPLLYAAYFALVSLVTGSTALAARDRKRRFRVLPVVKAGVLAALLGLVLPFPQPWGLTIAAVTAAVVQAVSPWSAPAANYARYAAKAAKRARRQVA